MILIKNNRYTYEHNKNNQLELFNIIVMKKYYYQIVAAHGGKGWCNTVQGLLNGLGEEQQRERQRERH